MSNAPWFKFFPSDWLLSRTVRLMTAEQRGIYIQLLCEQWYGGNGLPSDENALIQLAGCTADEWSRSSESILELSHRSERPQVQQETARDPK